MADWWWKPDILGTCNCAPHDPLLSPDILRQAIVGPPPRARLALRDCGHETPLEKPQETAALLEAFLAGLG